jgi:hypothetical protein
MEPRNLFYLASTLLYHVDINLSFHTQLPVSWYLISKRTLLYLVKIWIFDGLYFQSKFIFSKAIRVGYTQLMSSNQIPTFFSAVSRLVTYDLYSTVWKSSPESLHRRQKRKPRKIRKRERITGTDIKTTWYTTSSISQLKI